MVQFTVIFLLMGWRGFGWSAAWPLVPVIIVYQTVFNLALAMMMAAANVYFRDTQHLVGVLLSAWFFVSPVMYNWDFVAKAAGDMPWLAHVYWLNPMAFIITAYRASLLSGTAWPGGAVIWFSAVLPLGLFAAAYRIYQTAQRNFADYL